MDKSLAVTVRLFLFIGGIFAASCVPPTFVQTMSTDPRFPIGRFNPPSNAGDEARRRWISQIASLPDLLTLSVDGLSDPQLDTPYRAGGWTVRQVVHHLPDSHMNAYIRFRLSVTEDTPRIKPYDEKQWAELDDAKSGPIAPSLSLLRSLHDRWVRLLQSMTESDWGKAYEHPDNGRFPLTRALAMYAWHGEHHVAHITSLREREGW